VQGIVDVGEVFVGKTFGKLGQAVKDLLGNMLKEMLILCL
jgi:hypothetical protein